MIAVSQRETESPANVEPQKKEDITGVRLYRTNTGNFVETKEHFHWLKETSWDELITRPNNVWCH
jgi:hypothetical protein